MLGTRARSLPDCRPLLADPDDLTLLFQPIVDLAAASVAGYEALARFPGTAGPDVWFAAAAEAGLGAELEALAVSKALARVPELPAGTFLTVNVSAHLLGADPVQEAFAARPRLDRVVVALEHTPVDDLQVLRARTEALRDRGALIALDDTRNGYAGLRQMVALRPQLVRLDRTLVAEADTDPVRVALAEMVGEFAGRIDAELLAEGLETAAELAAFIGLGVLLGQGWVLAPPAPEFRGLAPEVEQLVRTHAARARTTGSVAPLLRPVRQVPAAEVDGIPPAVLTGPLGEPVALLLADPRTGQVHTAPVSLRVHPGDDAGETLRRALARPPAHRFDPVLCTDRSGDVLGLLRVEDLAAPPRPAASHRAPSPRRPVE